MPQEIPTRRAPLGLTLPIPRHIIVTSVALGLTTVLLGFSYLWRPATIRSPDLERLSVVAKIDGPLGFVMVAVGVWVVVAAMVGCTRASAHAVTSITHLAYVVAVAMTYVIAYPLQPLPSVPLAVFGFIAHGGACLAYWQRGWR